MYKKSSRGRGLVNGVKRRITCWADRNFFKWIDGFFSLLGFEGYSGYQKIEQHNHFLRHAAAFSQRYSHQFLCPSPQRTIVCKHSGNAGDIIYALPTVRTLAGPYKANLLLELGVKMDASIKGHPLGSVRLNEKVASFLEPLLLAQPYIEGCSLYTGQSIDYDLDLFREAPLDLSRGNIARWYFYCFGINADLGKPWLFVEGDKNFNDTVVIARSQRYNNAAIDYRFLNRYKNLCFIGVESEYREMKKQIQQIDFFPVRDFLQMAQIIKGAKLFIGNQSFPFSLAEALKVPRILEICPLCPNVIPEGPEGYDVCMQPQFERMVAKLLRD